MRNAQQRGSLRKLTPFVCYQIGGITMVIGTNSDIILIFSYFTFSRQSFFSLFLGDAFIHCFFLTDLLVIITLFFLFRPSFQYDVALRLMVFRIYFVPFLYSRCGVRCMV